MSPFVHLVALPGRGAIFSCTLTEKRGTTEKCVPFVTAAAVQRTRRCRGAAKGGPEATR
jgi:hypothetical protein